MTRTVSAKDLLPGQTISVDMGVGGHCLDEAVTITAISRCRNFFSGDVIKLEVRRYNGEKLNLVDYLPMDKVDLLNRS